MVFAATEDKLVRGRLRGRELWSFDPGATARPLGHACGQGYPRLDGLDPVLGGSLVLRGRGAVPHRTAVVYATFGQARALHLGTTRCTAYLDIGTPLFFLGRSSVSQTGGFQLSRRIPNDARLLGLQATSQALVAPTTGAG